jgi:uncharacterized protein (TIGR02466 family)
MANSITPVLHLFSAPLLQMTWKDSDNLNQLLRSFILDLRQRVPSERMSNAGGWQSPKQLQRFDEPCIREILKRIDVAVYSILGACLGEEKLQALERKWDIVAWANINELGDYNMIHNHSGGVWSGVYYVDPGPVVADHPQSGVLTFRNPTMAALSTDNMRVPELLRELFPPDFSVLPQSSMMLVFPSWLDHMVHPYFGDTPRISISWDASFR